MKEEWNSIKLADAVEILNGFAFKSSRYVPEGIRVIRISNVQKGYVEDKDPKFYPFSSKDEIKKYLLQEGDLLMSLTGNVGRVGLLPGSMLPCALNQRVACLRIKSTKLSKMYLFYFLNSNVFEAMCVKSSSGVAQLNMSTEWLKEQVVPLPSLPEQQRIVDILDQEFAKIDALKANAEKSLQAAKDLFQATLKKELEPKEGWEMKTFGEVGTFQRGGGFIKSDFVEEGFPCIHYGQIHMKLGTTTYSHITSIPKELAKKSKIASPGDIVIAITSEDVAGSCKSTAWMGDYDVAVGAHAAIFKHCLNPLYVSFFIQSCYFQREKEAYTHGFKVVEIKPSDIAKIPIYFPSLQEQQRIAEVLEIVGEKVEALQVNDQKTLTLCDDLKQSLLRKAFNGEL